MKIVSKVVDSSVYNAVFALKTPALDHSGISHLAEHMVFRGSTKYPANHELFIINSLLPATVNASTQNGVTFYFISSKEKSLFMLLLDYVYSGLVQITYQQSEFLLERDGVVYRELQMYEKHLNYAVDVAALRGDSSPENVYHYGGFSDTIALSSIEDLALYKQSFYRHEHITLYLNGPEQIDFKPLSQVSTPSKHHYYSEKALHTENAEAGIINAYIERRTHFELPSLTTDCDKDANNKESDIVITWRIHVAYHSQFKAQQKAIEKLLHKSEQIIIEDEINPLGQFAYRIITKRPNAIILKVLATLKRLPISAAAYELANSHAQNDVITACIRAYLKQHIVLPPALPFEAYLSSYKQSTLHAIQKKRVEKMPIHAQTFPSNICILAGKHLALENVPPIPKLFKKALQQDIGKFYTIENVHWLFELSEIDPIKLQALIISAEFWSPRLNGDCYAMGLGRYNGRLFIYGAEDSNAPAKESFITKMLETL